MYYFLSDSGKPSVIYMLFYIFAVSLYAWIAVFVLPINSAINPILYTLTTTHFRNWFMKTVVLPVFRPSFRPSLFDGDVFHHNRNGLYLLKFSARVLMYIGIVQSWLTRQYVQCLSLKWFRNHGVCFQVLLFFFFLVRTGSDSGSFSTASSRILSGSSKAHHIQGHHCQTNQSATTDANVTFSVRHQHEPNDNFRVESTV